MLRPFHLSRLLRNRVLIVLVGGIVAALPVIVGSSLETADHNPPPVLSSESDAKKLYSGNFESDPWQSTMRPTLSSGNSNFQIVQDAGGTHGKILRAHFAEGSYASHDSPAGTSATIFSIWFDQRGIDIGSRDDIYFKFDVRFQPGFDFAKSGKLPGLGGGANNAGGDIPSGYDGWTGRLIWRGQYVETYMYIPSATKYGVEMPWLIDGEPVALEPGAWQCLEVHYKLNSPGQSNGVIEGWLNDRLAISKNDVEFRKTEKLKIDDILFSTFFGGSTPDYASPKAQYADFDNLELSSNYMSCK